MKLIIAIVVALGLAIGLGMYAMEDPGYVVLSREPYTVRMPLALFVLALLLLFAVVYLLFNFMVSLFRAPKKVKDWRKGKKEVGAQQITMKGFANLIEGNWQDAEGNLLSSVEHNKASLMNYLGAAYAAQQRGLPDRRNEHIEAALAAHPRQELAIKLTRARMQMQSGEWGNARDQLEYVRLSAPRNVAAARLLADTYRQLGDWPSLVKLLPALKKLKAFPEEEMKTRETQALSQHIESPALLQGDGSRVDETFKALPRKSRKDSAAIAGYARQLIRSGEGNRAEAVLRKALNREWNGELARLFGDLETRNIADQINLLQTWGKGRDDDPDLNIALARLYRRDNQLDKARDLLAQVVSTTGEADALAELGDLLEQMGDQESALATYRQGIKLLSGAGVSAAAADGKLVALQGPDEESGNTMPVVSDQ